MSRTASTEKEVVTNHSIYKHLDAGLQDKLCNFRNLIGSTGKTATKTKISEAIPPANLKQHREELVSTLS